MSSNTPEKDPTPNDGTPIWDLVIANMVERDQEGRRKYGTPLQMHNGRDPLVDAYQEALDLAVYLRQAIEEKASLPEIEYLACPYAHTDLSVMYARFKAASKVAAQMMAAGVVIFSPLTQNHTLAAFEDFPRDWEFWKRVDFPFLRMSKVLHVLTLEGWKRSTGVAAEISYAKEEGMEVGYLNPADFGITHDGDLPLW